MIYTIVTGILMTYVGYVFGRAGGYKAGAYAMGAHLQKAINADPVEIIRQIKQQHPERTKDA